MGQTRIVLLSAVGVIVLNLSLLVAQQVEPSKRPYPKGFDPNHIPPLSSAESHNIILNVASLPFFDNMENGENGWTSVGFEHLIVNPQNIQVLNPIINPTLVRLPDPGELPVPHSGVGAWWYGENATGTFIGVDFDQNQPPLSGGTSTSANTGSLVSPLLDLTAVSTATLRFQTWWEIESVDADRFDMMYVEISTDGGSSFNELGTLNPLDDVNGEAYVPFTNSGLGLAATWEEHIFDLSPYAGYTVLIRFRFATIDELYNGFRGWFIDDVSVTATATPSPSVTQITPNVGNAGSMFQIIGSNFVTGATVEFNSTTIASAVLTSSKIGCEVPYYLPDGTYDVSVTNPTGGSVTVQNGFTITSVPAPSIFSVDPNTGLQGQSAFITISGENFDVGASATVGGLGLTGVSATATEITGYISPSLTLGSHNVRVQNSDGQYDVLVNGFTVNPLIRVISPNGGEVLNAAGSYNISYYLQAITAVKIEYSIDNGFYWNLITTTSPQGIGTHNYTWTPVPSVNSSYGLIKVSKLDNTSFYDISNSPFSIVVGAWTDPSEPDS